MKYVSARWSDYQNLKSNSNSDVHETAEDANANCPTAGDKILAFEDVQDAEAYVEALCILCEAAWTPNQSPEEKEENGDRIEQAQSILDTLEENAVESMNPWEE